MTKSVAGYTDFGGGRQKSWVSGQMKNTLHKNSKERRGMTGGNYSVMYCTSEKLHECRSACRGRDGRWLLATPPASVQFPLPPSTSAVASSAEEQLGIVKAIRVGEGLITSLDCGWVVLETILQLLYSYAMNNFVIT